MKDASPSPSPSAAQPPSHWASELTSFEAYLRNYLANLTLPCQLRSAIEYALLSGGKRLRPLLAIFSCQAVGGQTADALPAAAAVEMIHCFSLVHDDLPAMDDDDLRRGRPTLHKHTSEAMAILAGDAMMSQAMTLLLDQTSSPSLAMALTQDLLTGTNAMIAGQIYDTIAEQSNEMPPIEQLQRIHQHKTGALLITAAKMGARSGSASPEELTAIAQYAEAIGLMFQIVDDLLDVTQTTEQLGKTAGKDVAQNKLTYPALMGVKTSYQQVAQLQTQAHDLIAPLGDCAEHLHDLCDFIAHRQH